MWTRTWYRRALVVRVLAQYLRLPTGWDDVERQEFIDEAAEQVALRVAELADDWADRTVAIGPAALATA